AYDTLAESGFFFAFQSTAAISDWSLTITPRYDVQNGGTITIPFVGTAAPYPSAIDTSVVPGGLPGNISNLTVSINNYSHTFPNDVGALLASQNVPSPMVVMQDAGNSSSGVSGANLVFDDAAATLLPFLDGSGALKSGTYLPSDYVSDLSRSFSTLAPPYSDPATIGAATLASSFNGTDPNGMWKLYVQDFVGGDQGTIQNGWGLGIQCTCPADSQTQLMSSANPSSFNQSVTFTATVTSSQGTPFGSVQFFDGATLKATVSLSGGVATFTTSALSLGGPHNITAVYLGNTSFESSTSPIVAQTVNKAATVTTLLSSQNPSIVNSSVTFTANIARAFGGNAGGTVTFKDGATAIGAPVTVISNTAAVSISTLTIGSHSITATYSGNGNFNGSSNGLTQTVTPGPPRTSRSRRRPVSLPVPHSASPLLHSISLATSPPATAARCISPAWIRTRRPCQAILRCRAE
ncbi:MAG: hypothetical protein DMG68_16770, partial [Acidobacteria bacterium]